MDRENGNNGLITGKTGKKEIRSRKGLTMCQLKDFIFYLNKEKKSRIFGELLRILFQVSGIESCPPENNEWRFGM